MIGWSGGWVLNYAGPMIPLAHRSWCACQPAVDNTVVHHIPNNVYFRLMKPEEWSLSHQMANLENNVLLFSSNLSW